MTIDEAMGILTTGSPSQENATFKMWEETTQLGFEAMKRVQDMRISPCTTADEILSGETS